MEQGCRHHAHILFLLLTVCIPELHSVVSKYKKLSIKNLHLHIQLTPAVAAKPYLQHEETQLITGHKNVNFCHNTSYSLKMKKLIFGLKWFLLVELC